MSLDECLFCARTPLEDIQDVASQLKSTYIMTKVGTRSQRRPPTLINSPDEVALEAAKLIKKGYLIKPHFICGKKPKSWIAAALFIVCFERGLGVSQKTISEVSGVGIPTIRKRYRDLVRLRSEEPK